jgi:hypothetical protein
MNGNNDLLKIYGQLQEMKQTPEVKQIKKQIEETLYQNLRTYSLELSSIGDVIGYERLKTQLENALKLVELTETGSNKKKRK